VLALAGCVVDFVFGIVLHFDVENRIFQLARGADGETMVRNTAGLSPQAALNWRFKEIQGWVFWGDHFAGLATPIEAVLILAFALLLYRMFRQALPSQPVTPRAPRARPPRRRPAPRRAAA